MKINEHYIVDTDEGNRHPRGTEVTVILINHSMTDDRPIRARASEGQTEYWYSAGELKTLNEWLYENRN